MEPEVEEKKETRSSRNSSVVVSKVGSLPKEKVVEASKISKVKSTSALNLHDNLKDEVKNDLQASEENYNKDVNLPKMMSASLVIKNTPDLQQSANKIALKMDETLSARKMNDS